MFSLSRVVAFCSLWTAFIVGAQTVNEAKVKAKLAYNMARFTQWPESSFAEPKAPLLFCLLHRSDTLKKSFAGLDGLSVAGHPIRVEANPTDRLNKCHVVFFSETNDGPSIASLRELDALPVLTIGDTQRFAADGGMVELLNINDTVRFDVNLKAMRDAQLTISSQVLKLARQVKD